MTYLSLMSPSQRRMNLMGLDGACRTLCVVSALCADLSECGEQYPGSGQCGQPRGYTVWVGTGTYTVPPTILNPATYGTNVVVMTNSLTLACSEILIFGLEMPPRFGAS